MKAHIVENGIIVNTIEVDSLDVMPNLIEATEGAVGWSYSNGVFAAPVISDEEVAKPLREKRNFLLSESDWTQVADAPVDKAAWATYRQELRDITSQEGFPHEVNWPTKPE